jgi:tetratricopeptide (TPR) repeat protein
MGLLVIFSLSLFTSHYYYISVYWYSNLLVYILFLYLALGFAAGEDGGKILTALLLIFLGSGLLQSSIGIYEYFVGGQARVAGTFYNPSYYAGYLAGLIGFPLAGAVFDLWPEILPRKKMIIRCGLGLAAIIILLGMIVSASRAIFFAAIPVGLIFGLRFRRLAILALVGLAILLVVVPNPLRRRLLAINDDRYAWERVSIWKSSCRMIAHHPQGVGLGMYQYYYHRYASAMGGGQIGRYGVEASQAHNEILTFASEASPLAPIFVLAFLIIVGARIWRGAKNSEAFKEKIGWSAALSGSVLCIIGHSLVDFNLHQPPILILGILAFTGLLGLCSKSIPELVKTEEYMVEQPALVSGIVLGIGILFMALVTYQTAIEAAYQHYVKIKDPQKKIPKLYRLSRLPSGFAPLYYELGEELRKGLMYRQDVELGRQAVVYYGFAAHLNPENYQYYYEWADCVYRMATMLRSIQNFNESADLASRAVELAPDQVFSYVLLSNVEYVRRGYKGAEHWLRVSLDYEPYFLRARTLLVGILLNEGKLVPAEKEYSKLLSQQKEVDDLLKYKPSTLNSYQKLVVSYNSDSISRLSELIAQKSAANSSVEQK